MSDGVEPDSLGRCPGAAMLPGPCSLSQLLFELEVARLRGRWRAWFQWRLPHVGKPVHGPDQIHSRARAAASTRVAITSINAITAQNSQV
jgi:hypothetical protein